MTWNARATVDAAAYCESPICAATTSQVPTARIVTTPSEVTLQAPLGVTPPREYKTVRPDEAVAVIATLDVPKATFGGCGNVMFWFSDPTTITCVTDIAAVKFVFEPADAVIVQVPATVNVTTPPASVQAPPTANVGITPDGEPVTVEIAEAAGAYVPFGNGDIGTDEVKAKVWPACAIVIV